MLKKYFQASFVILALMVSFSAHAGFREALSALQHKDAERMVLEVEKAVKTKNYDGVTLFLPTLHYWYYKAEFVPSSIKEDALARLEKNKDYPLVQAEIMVEANWDGFLSRYQQLRLAGSFKEISGLPFPYQEVTRQLVKTIDAGYQMPIDTTTIALKARRDAVFAAEMLTENTGSKKVVTNEDRLAAIQKAAEAGSAVHQAILALLQIGEKEGVSGFDKLAKSDIVKLDQKAGYKKLEELGSLHRPAGYADSMCLVGDAYKNGLFGRPVDNKEAYLWYLRGFVRAQGGFLHCEDRMNSAYKEGWILKYDTPNIANIMRRGEHIYFNNFNETQVPKSVIQHQFQQDNPVLLINENLPNYYLKVFLDGRVKYSALSGSDGYDENAIYSFVWYAKDKVHASRLKGANPVIGVDTWKIQSEHVKKMLAELQLITKNSKTLGYDSQLCGNGISFIANRELTFGVGDMQKYFFRSDSWNPKERKTTDANFAAVLAKIEKYIPTQHLRCGEESLTKEYLACVAADKKIEDVGSQWLSDQKTNK